MASPYELFETNPEVEDKVGVIIDYGDFRIRIARAGGANKRFARVLQAKMQPYQRLIKSNKLDDEIDARIVRETYVETVVLGFEVKNADGEFESGVPNKDGSVSEFNKENVLRIFTELPDLFRDVQDQANNISLFRDEALKDSGKNS